MELGIEEWVRVLGQVVWLERRCFEVLGGWVAAEPEPAAKLLLGRQHAHHALHADLVRRVMPELRPGAADAAVGSAGEDVDAFFAALASASGPDQTAERLAGAYRVLLPRKIATYEQLRAATTTVADAPVDRVLRLVLVDEGDDLDAAEATVRGLLTAGDADRRAGAFQQTLDARLGRAGGLVVLHP